ncbi:uncharacterized protein LOC125381983 [Haliotis rufescens]|uniref:uncharacterized protein LOC125381983 n=1 Tax=Haliotis rufescens TaxID=6454 RepID=UPI00201F22A5|nr:uncharacterized protein LOC125381983 [Haliotis rufescens]
MEYEFEYTQEFENNESVALAKASFCNVTGYSFKKTTTKKHFNKNYIPTATDKPRILLNGRNQSLKPKDDTLYIIVSSQTWDCKYGKGRKEKNKEEPPAEHQYARKRTRERLFTTPKLDCGAKLHVREMLCFPYAKVTLQIHM